MNTKTNLTVLLFTLVFWTACSPTKHLPPNEKLYTGARVDVIGPDLTARQKKVLRSDLTGLTRPKPNTRFLGLRLKLSIYNVFHNKKPNSFWGKLRDKFGEPPVLLSEVDLEQNIKLLQNHLENKGWFHARVTGDTVVKRKLAHASYRAETGNQYKIASVTFPSDSSELSQTIAAQAGNTLLKPGEPFDLDLIKAERTRIDAAIKEKGFYFFSPDYLLLRTDSSIGNNQVNMFVVVKPEAPDQARRSFKINEVYIYSGYSLNTAQVDTLLRNGEQYKGFTIVDARKRFKPYVFEEAMQFDSGDLYNRADHNQTLSRLINLNEFRFVKNRFEVANTDSPRLNVYYYLTPLPKKSLRAEFNLISRSNNLNGSQINLSFLNRNLFRSATQFRATAYVGSDVQFSGALKGYNTYRTGAEVNLAIPRFVVPFKDMRRRGPYAPRTNIRLGYDILNRRKLYTLNSYRAEYGYTWKKNLQTSYEFFPISVSYVQALNVTRDFDSLSRKYVGLARAIEPQFILGNRFEYLFNQLANGTQPLNAFYFNGIVDLSGNIAGLLKGANAKKGDTVFIRNAPFAQYVKVEGDFRYYRKIGLKSTWANRIDIGIGLPYGNSTQIPYIKQFFSGGNNSLRGFRSRSVGPGTFFPLPDTADVNSLIPDQTGDIKFEFNTEFRPHISGPLYGAIFLDAGNIWLRNDSLWTGKPGAKFTSKFLSQLAVDVGVGIRLDIQVFVIRLDVAFPIRKPWQVPPGVLRDVNFRDPQWRRTNMVYNLAIGYPF